MHGQTNLFKRGSVYWFRKKVPVDLLDHYTEARTGDFRFSLRTRDRAAAKALAATKAADYERVFAEVRARRSNPVSSLNDDQLRLLTLAWTSHLLEEDEAERIEGMNARDLAKRAFTAELLQGAFTDALQTYDTSLLDDEALDFAASYGFHLEAGSRDARLLSVAFLKASQRANGAVSKRNAGEAVDTPQAPAIPLPASQHGSGSGTGGRTLESLRDYWIGKRGPAPKSISKINTAIRAFKSLHGTTQVMGLTKRHFMALRDAELTKGSTAATVSSLLSMLRSVFTLALSNDLIEANPTDAIVVEQPKNLERGRIEFAPADLQALFSSPIYATGWRPSRRKVGEAAFFLPIISLYTGMRLEEAGQLLVSDVVKDGNGWAFDVNNEGDKRTKNSYSNRLVPVHSKIIAAGLLDYIATLDPKGQLFPTLKPNKDGGRTATFSTWFGEYLKGQVGITDRRKRFHSFRHNFETAAREAEMDMAVRYAIEGRAPADEGGRYGSVPMGLKRRAGETIQYPGLSISRWNAK